MFDRHRVGLLDAAASAKAYIETLSLVPDETFDAEALEGSVDLGQGVPYFIQEHGSATWRHATGDPISLSDVQRAAPAPLTRSTPSIGNGLARRHAEKLSISLPLPALATDHSAPPISSRSLSRRLRPSPATARG